MFEDFLWFLIHFFIIIIYERVRLHNAETRGNKVFLAAESFRPLNIKKKKYFISWWRYDLDALCTAMAGLWGEKNTNKDMKGDLPNSGINKY